MPPVSKQVFMTTVWFVRHRCLAALAVIAVLSIPAYLAWETRHAIRQARDRTESASNLPVAIRPLDRSLPADVETVGAQSAFRDAALFHGHLFVAGPDGVVEYDANGAVVRRFRTGLELPPSGLVGLTVGVLAAASEPELLIATAADGLLTFDGRRMLHVRPDRPEQRKLTALLALTSGRLLLGTGTSGLLAFDGRRLTPAHPELANVAVTALAGTDADVWIGTLDQGVWHWRAGGVDRFDESRGLPDPRVLSIATHGDRAYVGTALGVAEFEGGHYVRTLGPGLFARAVAVRRDTLLVGTLDATLAEIPLGARSSRGARPILHDAPAPIERFVEAGGTLYALAEDALYSMDDRTGGLRRVVGADAGRLTDRNVSALALDAAGRLWVGYFDRGLDILSAQGERALHVENDRVFCVNRIVHDAAGGRHGRRHRQRPRAVRFVRPPEAGPRTRRGSHRGPRHRSGAERRRHDGRDARRPDVHRSRGQPQPLRVSRSRQQPRLRARRRGHRGAGGHARRRVDARQRGRPRQLHDGQFGADAQLDLRGRPRR